AGFQRGQDISELRLKSPRCDLRLSAEPLCIGMAAFYSRDTEYALSNSFSDFPIVFDAHPLYRSVHTVLTHRERLLARLHIRSRQALKACLVNSREGTSRTLNQEM